LALQAIEIARTIGTLDLTNPVEVWVAKGTYYPPESKYEVINHTWTQVQRGHSN